MRYYLLLSFLVFTFGCKESVPVAKMDLLKYGLPISIAAPEGAIVHADDMGIMHDVTVKSGEGYYIQIYGSDAISLDAKAIFGEKKAEIKRGPFFAEIVKEDEHGMIYKKVIDEKNTNYSFMYVKIQGDREFIFQTGLMGTFTLEQVQLMYESVQ